ncbi:MAG TPA: histidine phosphatase family protein [Solimonas sp.]|nr:histidine phosphatase family protein [Solimonas sp.]
MGQIFLVRHGQASFGAADYDNLSELGVEQSRILGRWFSQCGLSFDRVVLGGLRRHRQTAEACLAQMADVPPAADWVVDPGLDEYDHVEVLDRVRSELTGRAAAKEFAVVHQENPRRAFQQMFEIAMDRWMSGKYDHEYRETWSAFRTRCTGSVQRLVDDAEPSRRAVVFTSGGPITTIVQELLGLSDARAATLNWTLANSSVTRLLHQPGLVTLSTLNSYAHLEQLRDAKLITYR